MTSPENPIFKDRPIIGAIHPHPPVSTGVHQMSPVGCIIGAIHPHPPAIGDIFASTAAPQARRCRVCPTLRPSMAFWWIACTRLRPAVRPAPVTTTATKLSRCRIATVAPTRERGHDSRKGRQDRHKTELRGYRALRGRVLAGYGQQEQGKSTYPGGDCLASTTFPH